MSYLKKIKPLLILFLVVLILWSIYRYLFYFPEWIDIYIAKPILWLVPLFAIINYQKESWNLLSILNISLKNIFIGIIFGVIFYISYTLILSGGGFSFNLHNLSTLGLLLTILNSTTTALVEEIIFRGYIMTKFLEFSLNRFISILLVSIFFVIIHLPVLIFNPNFEPNTLLPNLNALFIASLAYSFIYLKTRSLTTSILTHAIWNSAIVIFG